MILKKKIWQITSVILKNKIFQISGIIENMHCRHIYEYIGSEICPDCGRYTHETDVSIQIKLHKQWIEDGKHLHMQCPQGGTIRGWWDI